MPVWNDKVNWYGIRLISHLSIRVCRGFKQWNKRFVISVYFKLDSLQVHFKLSDCKIDSKSLSFYLAIPSFNWSKHTACITDRSVFTICLTL